MAHLDISSTVDSTDAFMVTGAATTVVPSSSVFFNLVRGRPLRKLAKKIFDLSVLILGACLDVCLSLQTSRTAFFKLLSFRAC
jgi:hypothetical protein